MREANTCLDSHSLKKKVLCFRRYFEKHLDSIDKYRIHVGPRKHGYMVYDETFFHPKGAAAMYRKIVETRSTSCTAQNFRNLIKEQCSMLPVSGRFDYRSLFPDEGKSLCHSLNQFIHPELKRFLESCARISNTTKVKKQLKLHMVIALLCNLLDRRSCFLQTLLGLFAFANGLWVFGMRSVVVLAVDVAIAVVYNVNSTANDRWQMDKELPLTGNASQPDVWAPVH